MFPRITARRVEDDVSSDLILRVCCFSCRAVLAASLSGAPFEEKETQKLKETLALEALEGSLDLERLEVRERQVATTEDALTVWEAMI